MNRWIVVCAVLITAGCGSSGANSSSIAIRAVDPLGAQTAIKAQPDIVIVDVRTPAEYAAAHIEGAINIDFSAPDFAETIATLDQDRTYLVYCRSGRRSGLAMPVFVEAGLLQVLHLEKGINVWIRAGLPVAEGSN